MYQLNFEPPEEAKIFLALDFFEWKSTYFRPDSYVANLRSQTIPGLSIHIYRDCEENRIRSRGDLYIPLIVMYDDGDAEDLLNEIMKVDTNKEFLYSLDVLKFISYKLFPKYN